MITASVVFYETPEAEIRGVLDSLQRSVVDKVYVIDNSSSKAIEKLCTQYPKVDYQPSPNLGYGSGHNIGIRKSLAGGAKYHAVINPDIYWNGDAIKDLAQFMDENPDCGLVMPRILFPDGGIQYLCKLLPTPADLIGRRFVPLKGYTRRHNDYYEMRWSGYDKVMEIPCLSGCFMFMRANVLRNIGGFDERYFMYAEDMDLCRRIGEVSRTMYYPYVDVYHVYQRASYKNFRSLSIHMRSVIKYFNKWGWFVDKGRSEKNRHCIRLLTGRDKI